MTSTSVPGVPEQALEFIEFKGIDRTPQHTRIQDPGSAKIQFRPSDVAAAMAVFQTAGGRWPRLVASLHDLHGRPHGHHPGHEQHVHQHAAAAEPPARAANR